jgi:hypothetical protein
VGRLRATSDPSLSKHAVAADPVYAATNLPAAFLSGKAYTAFSAVFAFSGTGSANSRDRPRGSSCFAAATAVLIFLHSFRPLSASPVDLPRFEVHSAGTSAFVITPALRIALSPLDSPAAIVGAASARDAATGTAKTSMRVRRESIGHHTARFRAPNGGRWSGHVAVDAETAPEWRDSSLPQAVVDG